MKDAIFQVQGKKTPQKDVQLLLSLWTSSYATFVEAPDVCGTAVGTPQWLCLVRLTEAKESVLF